MTKCPTEKVKIVVKLALTPGRTPTQKFLSYGLTLQMKVGDHPRTFCKSKNRCQVGLDPDLSACLDPWSDPNLNASLPKKISKVTRAEKRPHFQK
jgi:hypothetical protein